MEECLRVAGATSTTTAELTAALLHFNETYAGKFQFSETVDVRSRLVTSLMSWLRKRHERALEGDFQAAALQSLKIICRETEGLDDLTSPDGMRVMYGLAGLVDNDPDERSQSTVQEEALKCLSNLLLKNPHLAELCQTEGVLEGVMKRIANRGSVSLSSGIKFFDARLLFLVTALAPKSRCLITRELHGIPSLVRALQLDIVDASGNLVRYTDEKSRDMCELLKVLYSLTLDIDGLDEQDFKALDGLVHVVRLVLLSEDPGWSTDIKSHAINILINMPSRCVSMLVPSVTVQEEPAAVVSMYEDCDVSAIDALIAHLLQTLSCVELDSPANAVISILTAMRSCAKSSRIIRKHMRGKILPPLHHVTARPEDSGGLKSLLVQQMTSHITHLKEMVADFLFILCKENVSRLIKHTGYGNAAGMLFQRGLLGGDQPSASSEYSSDEDSDTNEYLESDLDPITGGPVGPKLDANEDLTEEEKEVEAVKLMHLFQQLNSNSCLKVVPIGEDGKPLLPDGNKEGEAVDSDDEVNGD